LQLLSINIPEGISVSAPIFMPLAAKEKHFFILPYQEYLNQ
jgi:hypothetical protein